MNQPGETQQFSSNAALRSHRHQVWRRGEQRVLPYDAAGRVDMDSMGERLLTTIYLCARCVVGRGLSYMLAAIVLTMFGVCIVVVGILAIIALFVAVAYVVSRFAPSN